VGAGTFTLNRSTGNTYSGTTTVNGGKLVVKNDSGSGTGTGPVVVNTGATLGGTGTISGAVTINSGAHLSPENLADPLQLGSLTLASGSQLDFLLNTAKGNDITNRVLVASTNGLTINGGTINLTDLGSATGGVYTLIDYVGVLNGSFGNLSLGTTPAGFSFRLFNDTANTLIGVEVTAPGDFNHDGAVDGGDYVVWQKGLGTTYTQADFDAWRANFGKTYAPAAAAELGAVPEPAAVTMLGVGAVVMLAGYRQCILLSPRRG
jgi:autotransporter-associated beta strand protein